jgi:hypothetical protein
VLPEEDLAKLMHACFDDRIEIKGEMLRRVRSGSTLTEVPSAETDESIEIPVALEDGTLASTELSSAATRPRRRWLGAVLGSVALVTGWGVVTLAVGRRTTTATGELPSSHPVPSTSSIATSASAGPATPTPPTSQAPTAVSIQIETIPSGAAATVASPAGERRCVTPCTLLVDKSGETTDIAVEKPGFVTQREPVHPDMDQRTHLTLQPVEARGRSATPRRSAPPKASAAPFQRFD